MVNPLAVALVAFCTVVGYLIGGRWAVGLAVGLGVVIAAELSARRF